MCTIDEDIYQWDTDKYVTVEDDAATYVHFAQRGRERALIVEVADGQAAIPNILMQQTAKILAYEHDGSATLGEPLAIKPIPRARPDNHVNTITKIYDTEAIVDVMLSAKLETAIPEALEGYVTSDELTDALADYATTTSVTETLADYATTEAVTTTVNTALADYALSDDVDSAIAAAVSSVYEAKGSCEFSALDLTASEIGDVWNITDDFETSADFVEGAGEDYPAGTNVVCVSVDGALMWDALAGTTDLSAYATTESVTAALADYATTEAMQAYVTETLEGIENGTY